MADDLHVDIDDHGVMTITIDRPERMNALTPTITGGLLGALDTANSSDEVRAVILTGTGRAFCAGADAVSHNDDRDKPAERSRHARMDALSIAGRIPMAMRECDVPLIAAVNGAAAGAGLGLALACDVRFASESARLGTVFVKRGLSTDYGVSYWLPRIVGPAQAFELAYLGDVVDSKRALEIGLVNRVYADDLLMEEATAFARRIAAGPPLAYTSVRRLLIQATDTGMRDFLEQEWAYQSRMRVTADATEGFASFVEKRDPVFRGE